MPLLRRCATARLIRSLTADGSRLLTLAFGLLIVMASVGGFAYSAQARFQDPVARLLQELGQRGVNLDGELAELNELAHLRRQPDQARARYAALRASLETKLAAVRSAPLPDPDNALMAHLAAGGVRILAITAHPDDENMMSGLLAFARDYHNPVLLLCLTRGEAGEQVTHDRPVAEVGQRRTRELHAAATVLDIAVIIAGFPNGAFKRVVPGRTFWFPQDVLRAWRTDRDPARVVKTVATRFAPDLVLTLEPNWGWTGNPEHRAAAVLAREAAQQAGAQLAYAVMADTPHTDRFDTTMFSSHRGQSYWAVKLAAARQHRSQYRLPPDAEHHPERFPHLAVEHFQRVETP